MNCVFNVSGVREQKISKICGKVNRIHSLVFDTLKTSDFTAPGHKLGAKSLLPTASRSSSHLSLHSGPKATGWNITTYFSPRHAVHFPFPLQVVLLLLAKHYFYLYPSVISLRYSHFAVRILIVMIQVKQYKKSFRRIEKYTILVCTRIQPRLWSALPKPLKLNQTNNEDS